MCLLCWNVVLSHMLLWIMYNQRWLYRTFFFFFFFFLNKALLFFSAENIVLFEDSTGHLTIKLADFGGATYFSEEVDCLSWTPAYMSPEMDQFYLNRQFPGLKLIPTSCGKITEKCDVYSLALSILFIYVRGHVLIKHVTQGNQNMVGREKADAVSMQILIKVSMLIIHF